MASKFRKLIRGDGDPHALSRRSQDYTLGSSLRSQPNDSASNSPSSSQSTRLRYSLDVTLPAPEPFMVSDWASSSKSDQASPRAEHVPVQDQLASFDGEDHEHDLSLDLKRMELHEKTLPDPKTLSAIETEQSSPYKGSIIPGRYARKPVAGQAQLDTSEDATGVPSKNGNDVGGLNGSSSVHSTAPNIPSAAEIVARSKYNSATTEVTKTFAPVVTHENVVNKVHHIHEQQITREIHNHDIYHRILPVIDVEVLPPRHFLHTQDQGLVEISADQIPARSNHWVIAETVSQIPSDEHPALSERTFTARKFSGDEGDTKHYISPEGHEVTEQTWVHPPRLETGAQDTGQTVPVHL